MQIFFLAYLILYFKLGKEKIGIISIILSVIFLCIAFANFHTNPLNNTDIIFTNAKVVYTSSNISEYQFEVNNEIVKGTFKSIGDINNNSIIPIRYNKKNPEINAVNMYDFIFDKEIKFLWIAAEFLILGIGIIIINKKIIITKNHFKKMLMIMITAIIASIIFTSYIMLNVSNKNIFDNNTVISADIVDIDEKYSYCTFFKDSLSLKKNRVKINFKDDTFFPCGSNIPICYSLENNENVYVYSLYLNGFKNSKLIVLFMYFIILNEILLLLHYIYQFNKEMKIKNMHIEPAAKLLEIDPLKIVKLLMYYTVLITIVIAIFLIIEYFENGISTLFIIYILNIIIYSGIFLFLKKK